MKIKKALYVFAAIFELALLMGASTSPQQDYIKKYAPTAVREMYRSGVPASITLAQGLLESRAGQSPLASEGNNHFGIKCHKDWTGKTMKVDDDRPDECFRVYDNAEESFHDHSDFLRYRDRYKFLFEFDITDYTAWANGLKKAGYATDPQYAGKLIKIVEDYGLSVYDKVKLPSDFPEEGESELIIEGDYVSIEPAAAAAEEKVVRIKNKTASKKLAKNKKPARQAAAAELPESPAALEAVTKIEKKYKEEFHFSLSRDVFSQNGVPFINTLPGETYASIAEDNNLFLKEILKFNDVESVQPLEPGTRVYLQAKKNQTRKGLDKYIVDSDGESLREICQRFGVKMSAINKLNSFEPGHTLREGDTILLRTNGKKN